MVLADARAILPSLLVRDAEPEQDTRALKALAEWCLRYSPQVAIDSDEVTPFALMLEITGCAHLVGGEAAMLSDIQARLKLWGFAVRTAIAESQAKAWAFAYLDHHAHLEDLPTTALRLDDALILSLRRLGLTKVGELAQMPRRALLQRFPAILVERLDALLAERPERFVPWREVPTFTARLNWPEPIGTTTAIEAAMRTLVSSITHELDHARRGARRLRLVLGRIDGGLHEIELRLGRPQRDPAHISRLFAMKFDHLDLDIGFGIEFMALEVSDSATLEPEQTDLVSDQDQAALAQLTDQLRQRLGRGRINRLQPIASHIPERAQQLIEADASRHPLPWLTCQPRPLRLWQHPVRLQAMAEIPDGPPLQITTNGERRRVATAFGPERIEPEWWRLGETMRVRDYWRVVDQTGGIHWLYRAGHYGDHTPPQWFRHGVFQ